MQEIKKIKIISLANIAALIYALFGFIISFAASIYALVLVLLEKQTAGKLLIYVSSSLGLNFLIALAVALIAGAIGWLVGLIAAAFYNYLAGQIGGVKIEMAGESFNKAETKPEEKKPELFKY